MGCCGLTLPNRPRLQWYEKNVFLVVPSSFVVICGAKGLSGLPTLNAHRLLYGLSYIYI